MERERMSTEITVCAMIIILFASFSTTLGGWESANHFFYRPLDFSVEAFENRDFGYNFTTEILKGWNSIP